MSAYNGRVTRHGNEEQKKKGHACLDNVISVQHPQDFDLQRCTHAKLHTASTTMYTLLTIDAKVACWLVFSVPPVNRALLTLLFPFSFHATKISSLANDPSCLSSLKV